jgi:hypothetical protein
MDVVCHEDIGMDHTVIAINDVLYPVKIGGIIIVFKEDWLPAVPTLDDMHRYVSHEKAWLARHFNTFLLLLLLYVDRGKSVPRKS